MRLKRLALKILMAIALVSVGLAGCGYGRSIDNRTLLFGLGIGLGHHGYHVVGEQINPMSSPAASVPAPGKSAGPSNIFISGRGRSLLQSLQNMQQTSPGYVDLSNLSVVVFSNAVARRGIQSALSAFIRTNQTRMNAWTLVATGSAAQVIRTRPKVLAGSAYQQLMQIESFPANSFSGLLREPLWKLYSASLDAGVSPVLPLVGVAKDGNIQFVGSALFHRGRMTGHLTEKQTEVLGMLMTPSTGPVLAVHVNGELAAIKITHSAVHIQMSSSHRVHVAIKSYAKILDVRGHIAKVSGSFDRTIEQAAARKVSAITIQDIQALQQARCDALSFGATARATHPQWWSTVSTHWARHFSHLPVHVQSQVYLDGPMS